MVRFSLQLFQWAAFWESILPLLINRCFIQEACKIMPEKVRETARVSSLIRNDDVNDEECRFQLFLGRRSSLKGR